VLGLPLRAWLERFLLSHRCGARGWERLAWPDGGPLLAQSWPQVLALETVGDELERIAAERRRQARNRGRGG
jgi:hypothetical protein